MQRIVVWYLLLNKRLFRKAGFLAVMCLLPLMMLAIKYMSVQDNGMMTIGLVAEDASHRLSHDAIDSLSKYEGVLRYEICADRETAVEQLKKKKIDAAWIFPKTLEQDLTDAAKEGYLQPVVTVLQREKSTELKFTQEILANAVYPAFSYEVYKNYLVSADHLGLDDLSEEEIRSAYDKMLMQENLFEMTYLDGGEVENSNYLLAPMRGLLAVWLLLCGFTACLYYMQDAKKGIYLAMPAKSRFLQSFLIQMIFLSDGVLVFLVACFVAGIFTNLWTEVVIALVYALCVLVFCNLLRLLLRKQEWICAVMPILLVGMMVINPVFINLRPFKEVRYLFPVNYYLRAVHNPGFLYAMGAYALVGFLLCVLIHFILSKQKTEDSYVL